MLDLMDINFEIENLMNDEPNFGTYDRLSDLIIVRNELEKDKKEKESRKITPFNEENEHIRTPKENNTDIDRRKAIEWSKVIKNEDGTIGAHWDFEQAESLMARKNLSYKPEQFFLAINLVYALLYSQFKKHGISNIDTYIEFAESIFLNEKYNINDKLNVFFNNL